MKNYATLKQYPALCCLVFFFAVFNCYSQPTLYGVKNSGQNYQYVSIDCSNDSITVLSQLPFNHFGMYFNSCFDADNQKYFYTSGQALLMIDAATGVLDDSIDYSGINPFYLNCIVYNPRDGHIYGIKHNIVTQANFFSYLNLSTRQVTDIAPLPTDIHSSNTAYSAIDTERQWYIIQSTTLTGIDIATGQVIFHNPVPTANNQSFSHMAISCKSGSLYGLWNEPVTLEEYFSQADTASQISMVNPMPLPVFFDKSFVSGSAIDYNSDIFYYSALQGKLYGVDIHSGNLVYQHGYGPGFEFLFLESASDYYCPVASSSSNTKENSFTLYPNPAGELLIVSTTKINSPFSMRVLNMVGQTVIQHSVTKSQPARGIDVSGLPQGIYILQLSDGVRNFCKSFAVAR